jgi:hypothetical protein
LTEEPDVWEIRLSGSAEGPGNNRRYGGDVVAPPGNQAANREDKLQPIAMEGPGLLDNVQHRMMNKKTNVEQRMVIDVDKLVERF